MRYLGFDLGIKSLGISMSDKTNTLVSPFKVINFKREEYESIIPEIKEIINKYGITKVILGLPKNMNGSIGFAGERSLKFKELLEKNNIEVELIDERLTTKEAENIIHSNAENIKNTKHKIDAIAASLILESYLRKWENNDIKK